MRLEPGEEVGRASRAAAAAIAPALHQRLVEYYGPWWLEKINEERRQRGLRPEIGLTDARFCLKLFVRDPATQQWATPQSRRTVKLLKDLADRAAHNHWLTAADVAQAHRLAAEICGWSPAWTPPTSGPPPVRGRDIERKVRLAADELSAGRQIAVRVVLLGTGQTKTVRVRMPAGAQYGQTLRIRGRGEPGPGGGPAGDLYLHLARK
ncbi:hypothetical protein GCM10027168_26280 [Streptomyces capparidis]